MSRRDPEIFVGGPGGPNIFNAAALRVRDDQREAQILAEREAPADPFVTQNIGFEIAGKQHTVQFQYYLMAVRTPANQHKQPEVLSMQCRFREQKADGSYGPWQGVATQKQTTPKAVRDGLGLVLNARLENAIDIAYPVSPLVLDQHFARLVDDKTMDIYGGKVLRVEGRGEAVLLRFMEQSLRANPLILGSPDLDPAEIFAMFLRQRGYQGQVNVEAVFAELAALEDFVLPRAWLDASNVTAILDHGHTSKEIREFYTPDAAGNVHFGKLHPVILYQVRECLRELDLRGSMSVQALQERLTRDQQDADAKTRASKVVPTYYFKTPEGYASRYSLPSPQEFSLPKDMNKAAFLTRVLGNPEYATVYPVASADQAAAMGLLPKPGFDAYSSAVAVFDVEPATRALVPPAVSEDDLYMFASDLRQTREGTQETRAAMARLEQLVAYLDRMGVRVLNVRGRLSLNFSIGPKAKLEDREIQELIGVIKTIFGISRENEADLIRRVFIDEQLKILDKDGIKAKDRYLSFQMKIGPKALEQHLLAHLREHRNDYLRQLANPASYAVVMAEQQSLSALNRAASQLRKNPNAFDEIRRHLTAKPSDISKILITGEGSKYDSLLHWIAFAFAEGGLTAEQMAWFLSLPGAKALINQHNGYGYIPLHEGVIKDAPFEVYRLLLEYGCNANIVTYPEGNTVLNLLQFKLDAAARGINVAHRASVAKILYDIGLSPHILIAHFKLQGGQAYVYVSRAELEKFIKQQKLFTNPNPKDEALRAGIERELASLPQNENLVGLLRVLDLEQKKLLLQGYGAVSKPGTEQPVNPYEAHGYHVDTLNSILRQIISAAFSMRDGAIVNVNVMRIASALKTAGDNRISQQDLLGRLIDTSYPGPQPILAGKSALHAACIFACSITAPGMQAMEDLQFLLVVLQNAYPANQPHDPRLMAFGLAQRVVPPFDQQIEDVARGYFAARVDKEVTYGEVALFKTLVSMHSTWSQAENLPESLRGFIERTGDVELSRRLPQAAALGR